MDRRRPGWDACVSWRLARTYHVGEPIPLMLERVKKWLSEGIEVRIVTARVASTSQGREKALCNKPTVDCKYVLPVQEGAFNHFAVWCNSCGKKLISPVLVYLKAVKQ